MRIGSTSRRLLLIYLAVVLPVAAGLVWLGARLLDQEREIATRRDVERQEAATDAVVRVLTQQVVDAERRLSAGQSLAGAARVRMTAAAISVDPANAVAWLPAVGERIRARHDLFLAAEQQEFSGDAALALAVYRTHARSSDPAVRAGALVRSARVSRARRNWTAAAADYRALARIQDVSVDGMPADLIGRRALCDVLQAASLDLQSELSSLAADFARGRWRLDRAAWEITRDHLRHLGAPIDESPETLALAQAVQWISEASLSGSGRDARVFNGRVVTILWQRRGDELVAFAVPPVLIADWLKRAVGVYPAGGLRLAVAVTGGRVGEAVDPPGRVGRRIQTETGLPWAVAVAPGETWNADGEIGSRRRLLLAALGALGLLLASGTYMLWHVVRRELAIGRLQADFVSAVSHEFRTPLTSLRHVIDLLEEDDGRPAASRRSYYAVLGRSTDRLQRLVESLLDFGRMEEGRKPYELQAVDAAELVSRIATEFERDAAARGRAIEISGTEGVRPAIRADPAALGHALWNLLDNAVKYSPGGGPVRVSLEPRDRQVAIAVEDQGLGIPPAERRDIMLKFVRGAKARELGIKGTGVGLAIVSHIIGAHGGAVEIDSEEGRGSTVRLVLPAAS